METCTPISILRWDQGRIERVTDLVTREYSLLIHIDGQPFCRLLCSPSDLSQLAAGHIFGEGLIESAADISSLTVDENSGLVDIRLVRPWPGRDEKILPVLTTGLGPQKSLAYGRGLVEKKGPLAVTSRFTPEEISRAVRELQDSSQVFIDTGGAHSCALFDKSGQRSFFEDLGRHNALDKLIGDALLRRLEIGSMFLVTSGRIPGYMVLKCYGAGIPLVVSRAAVTDSAVDLARKANMTLVGFARNSRMNIYTVPERIDSGPRHSEERSDEESFS